MLYWILNDIGSQSGEIIRKYQFHALKGYSPNTIEKLLNKGVIRVIQNPPSVRIIPELKAHATVLEKRGVLTLMDVLEMERSELQNALSITDEQAKALLSKVESILRPDTPLQPI